MNQPAARLFSDVQASLPYIKGSDLNLPKFMKFLDISSSDMGKILNKSTRQIQRYKVVPRDIRERLQPLHYAITLLVQIATLEEVKRWMHEPLPQWKGRSPMDELIRGNIEGVLNIVERIRAGEAGY